MNSRGSAMVSSLLAMAVLAILGATVYRLTRNQIVESVYQMRLAQAHELAEAGVEDALRELVENPGWRAGFTKKPFGEGYYTVKLSTDSPPQIASTGYAKPIFLFGRAAKTVRVATVFALAVGTEGAFCRAGSQYKVDGTADAYDSSVTPDPASFVFGANIWSNGSVVTKEGAGVRVRGDVIYTSGSGPKAATVEGTVSQYGAPGALPSHSGAAYASANDNLTGLTPASVYNAATKKVKVPSGVTATLMPGRYYFNEVVVEGTLKVVTDSGAVTVYLNGNWNGPSSSTAGRTMNTSRYPARFAVYGQGADKLYLNSTTPLHAYVEAPLAQVDLTQVFYGNIIGNMINVSDVGAFHFDLKLGGAGGVRLNPRTWTTTFERL
ncbi:hypothetical protein EPO15_07840 [bacterium]|nr:MAG: hypothetical protein EPO15_07840 [bacterium]